MRVLPVLVSAGLVTAGVGVVTAHATMKRGGCHLAARYDSSTSDTGNVYAVFVPRNDGDRTCGPDRYPKLKLLGRGNKPLATHQTSRDVFAPPGPRLQELRAGTTGSFTVTFRPLTAGGSRRCRPVAHAVTVTWAGRRVRVVLPTTLHKLREPINPCGGNFIVARLRPSS
jgi:hypothetical protein